MSFFEDASLVLIPSAQKTSKVYSVKPTDGTGDLTFTRSNDTATRVASNGLIEKVRTNLALQSQSFATSAVWGTVNGTVTNNAGTAPDGTNTASKIVATNSDPFVYQSLTLSGPVMVSCYVKGIGSSIGKTGSVRAGSSLTNFTITGDWQRVSLIHTAGGAQNYGVETPESAAVSDEVLLWGFQVEYGDVATDYIATTSAAVSVGPVANVPRLDYLNSSCPRLLLEPQRQNVITFSEQMDNAVWFKDNTTVTSGFVSPTGYANAFKLTEQATNAVHSIYQSFPSISSSVYTASAFVKKGERFKCSLADRNTGAYVSFNLNTGTIIASGTLTGKIEAYGNDWYRITITSASALTVIVPQIFVLSDSYTTGLPITLPYVGDGTSGIYIWGAQLEAGAYATSYIPTLGAAVTRGADTATKNSVSTLIGQTEGVLYAEVTIPANADAARVIATLGGSNRFGMTAGAGNVGFFIVTGAGGVVYSSTTAFTHGATTKMALAYKSGQSSLYVNGTQVLSTTATFAFNASITDLFFGNFELSVGTNQNGQKQAQALLFKTRLTNAQLAELTTL